MSSNITNISHGQANWDTAINQNFQNLDADSGWIEISIIAPFKGWMRFRKTARLIEVIGSIMTTEVVENIIGTKIGSLPENLLPSGAMSHYLNNVADGAANATARSYIDDLGNIFFLASNIDTTKFPIRLSTIFML